MRKVNQKDIRMDIGLRMRKHIQCPKCKSRIIDSSLSTVTEIRALSARAVLQADYYIKCKNCNTELGLRKLA